MPVELRHWRAFIAAAEARHFSAAAERLGISQPALSQLIRTLETSLGSQLFDRQGRRARLNEAGHALLPEARATTDQALRAERIGVATGRVSARMVAAGYVGSAAFHPGFTALIGGIGGARPAILIRLDQCHATAQVQYLRDHLLDIGIVRSPLPELGAAIASLRLASERMIVALPHGHRLAAEESCSLRSLATEPFIQYLQQPSGGLRELMTRACRAAGFEPRVVHTVPQVATMLCLTGAGVGVALVPQTMARFAVEGVVYRALVEPVMTELTLLYRRSDTAPALRAVLRLARRLDRAATHR